jgi:regulator of protease activity HflC (stomatin/prohibitin superfamily)
MARIDLIRNLESKDPRRRRAVIFLAGAIGVLVAVWLILTSATTYIRPFESGIRQSRYGGGLAAEAKTGPKLVFTGPGVTYHLFPTVVQILNLNSGTGETNAESKDARSISSLEVDSLDGSKIRIDATILYRIIDPYTVMTKIGPGRLFEDNAMIPKGQQALKQALGQLRAEDFYSETLRVQATEAARTALNESVKEFGLQVDYVLVRQYVYLADYQSQIEERKVQDQLVFTNQSMTESKKMEAARMKTDAEGQAQVDLEGKRGDTEVSKIRAEADLYSRKKKSEGDLLVSLAQAKGTELENAAYKASAGSDNLVGLEMAEVLDGIDVIFLQSGPGGTNVLDVNDTLKMFDIGGN